MKALVQGGGEFAVRRIYCVGQNYRAHAREMGGDPEREQPFFFGKPADALVQSGGMVPYPPMTQRLDHEVELVAALGAGAQPVGYAVGLDMTRRDLQLAAKAAGRPWDMAKGFDDSAPLGAIRMGPLPAGAIWLAVNGVRRQASTLEQMIWNVPEIIAELGRYVTLREGDLLFTGTPAGVGPVVRGDRLEAHIDGLPDLEIGIG